MLKTNTRDTFYDNFLLNPGRFEKSLGLNLDDLLKMEKTINLIKLSGKSVNSIEFTDFDDTIYSRKPQLCKDIFEKNRGKAGNDIVEYKIGFNNFFETYYNPQMVVEELLRKTDVILTAGREIIQNGKIKHTNTDHIKSIIVDEHKLKPRAILNWILENKVVPQEIIFNDDKAFALEKEFQDLSELLGNRIILNNVILGENKIDAVKDIKTIVIEQGQSNLIN